MAIPSYKCFIDPILRFLAEQEGSVASDLARDAAADALLLTASDREQRLSSGKVTYRDRAGWAFDRLKRAGFANAPSLGLWTLTASGRAFAAATPSLTDQEIAKLAAANPSASDHAPNSVHVDADYELGVDTVAAPGGDRKAYRLEARPVATGGQAEVFRAVRKKDSQQLILKRVLGQSGERRMQREIRVQSLLRHPSIMPILDWDPATFRWYVMPLGRRAMSDLTRPVEWDLLCSILESVLAALECAHDSGHPHRDLKPHNIIELVDPGGISRWVLADWGLTRRPLGQTTSALTKTGHAIGTDGYAPPEAYTDAHNFGETGDIYSLGQVIAWATGVDPIPNVPPRLDKPWQSLVERMTRLNPAERMQSVVEVHQCLQALRSDSSLQ